MEPRSHLNALPSQKAIALFLTGDQRDADRRMAIENYWFATAALILCPSPFKLNLD